MSTIRTRWEQLREEQEFENAFLCILTGAALAIPFCWLLLI